MKHKKSRDPTSDIENIIIIVSREAVGVIALVIGLDLQRIFFIAKPAGDMTILENHVPH